LREISLNGYIDEEVWYGDEITPAILHDALYGEDGQASDDVHIRLNSYGGDCNAAVRMFDDIRAYPGNVTITVSGTAASAATVLAMAANRLEMTPGSLFMIHDPSVVAWGNERDLSEAIALLRACKDSILNIYGIRSHLDRGMLAAMMAATTWMDANAAVNHGFIDAIGMDANQNPTNAERERSVNRDEAAKRVQAWMDRHKSKLPRSEKGDDHTSAVPSVIVQTTEPVNQNGAEQIKQPEATGIPVAQLEYRLGLIMPSRRD